LEKMKVAIYIRVSTEDQTVQNQELALREYCQKEEYEIYQIYKDEGISGSKTSRPALDKMLTDMRNKNFDLIIVWKYDRLGRSTIHLLQILEEMKSKGIRLIATTQNIDTSTPMGKFFVTNLLALSELEREMIRERVNLGLKRAKSQGKTLGRPKGSKDKRYRKKSGYYNRFKKD